MRRLFWKAPCVLSLGLENLFHYLFFQFQDSQKPISHHSQPEHLPRHPTVRSSTFSLYVQLDQYSQLLFPLQTLTTDASCPKWLNPSLNIHQTFSRKLFGLWASACLEFCSCTDRLALMYPHNFMACKDPFYSLKLSNCVLAPVLLSVEELRLKLHQHSDAKAK